ncbi:adenylate cyclase [Enterobacter asburiae]|uniref:Adenylate cyclase n=1 Tax=Enterobacter asburiae TaxID=61645 RepID=A0A376FFC8_ENTAS|nr:adenylate cyclase [Enterobacter asburiae]
MTALKPRPGWRTGRGLKHAIETRQHIEIEHFRNEAISQEPFWLHSGKR